MARAICRCGQPLPAPAAGSDRVVCPKCGARVRIRGGTRPDAAEAAPDDGFIRFFCPCGRRLKVPAAGAPASGKCPDCGATVPVPRAGTPAVRPASHPEAPTEELSAGDVAALDAWARRMASGEPTRPAMGDASTTDYHAPSATPGRVEAGLRVCPRCGKPIHLGADACRGCGTSVPKR